MPSLLLLFGATLGGSAVADETDHRRPTTDDGTRFFLKTDDLAGGEHHTRHAELFGKRISGYNRFVLEGIDAVQAHAPAGGGYFIGVRAKPAESPVGYPLQLFGRPLLDPPRPTSYCSGSSYAAFIETLNRILPDGAARLSDDRREAMRMQEADGGRREDWVKFWGIWNSDGFGSQFALVQYAGMGEDVTPERARPGDFMNISWKNGPGHSVVFLGWRGESDGAKQAVFWSSQKGSDGYGDQVVAIERIAAVKIVRLTKPENLFAFDVKKGVNRKVPGDRVDF